MLWKRIINELEQNQIEKIKYRKKPPNENYKKLTNYTHNSLPVATTIYLTVYNKMSQCEFYVLIIANQYLKIELYITMQLSLGKCGPIKRDVCLLQAALIILSL